MVLVVLYAYLLVGLSLTVKYTKWTWQDVLYLAGFVYSWPLWVYGTIPKRPRKSPQS